MMEDDPDLRNGPAWRHDLDVFEAWSEGTLAGVDPGDPVFLCPYPIERPALRAAWIDGFGTGRVVRNFDGKIDDDGHDKLAV